MSKAIVYTKDYCNFCVKAKALLDARNIPYEERMVDVYGRGKRILTENQSWVTLEDLLKEYPSAKTLPQIWLDGKHVGGFTELKDLLDAE
jgi:glutaredoxin 3